MPSGWAQTKRATWKTVILIASPDRKNLVVCPHRSPAEGYRKINRIERGRLQEPEAKTMKLNHTPRLSREPREKRRDAKASFRDEQKALSKTGSETTKPTRSSLAIKHR